MRLLAGIVALIGVAGCERPTRDDAVLRAISAESRQLMKTQTLGSDGWADVPEGRWPQAIASQKPYVVTVRPSGVDILIKPGMDGGWGYEVPKRGKRDLGMLPECYEDLGHGVFWHGPC